MKRTIQVTFIGLLAVLTLLAGCASNRYTRNMDDGILDNGTNNLDGNRITGRIYNDNINDGLFRNDTAYDRNLMPGNDNILDRDYTIREDNVRRGITTQLPSTTLPNLTNNNTTGNVTRGNTQDQVRTNTNKAAGKVNTR